MKWVRGALFASSLIGAAAVGSSALADEYLISHTDTTNGNWESLNVEGVDANAPAVGILFTVAGNSPTDAGGTLLVLCDDLFHTVSVPVSYAPGNELEYNSANLSGNSYYVSGSGTQLFDLKQASLLGQLVNQAQELWAGGAAPANITALNLTTDQEIAAIQGAIWGIEYKTTVVDNYSTANFDTAITDFRTEFTDYTTDGIGLYSTNGTQNQLLGLPAGVEGGPGGIPEPAAWLTMLLGITAAGALLRRRRALSTVVA
ncbi:MAG TPA: PEP-CTERM sorting domain-containing protein [Caulobacteraceae bacterium]|nr:PEP-CTERM sorting domain-containing protein [Caulobacteraceae bacterium]